MNFYRGLSLKEKVIALKNLAESKKVLHCFGYDKSHGGHGLGDTIMLTSVLRHLRSQRPNWRNFVAVGPGRQSTFGSDLCEGSYLLGQTPSEKDFDQVVWYSWQEHRSVFPQWPSTKTVKCLVEQYGLACDWSLLRYQVNVTKQAEEAADRYVGILPSANFVCIHYQGNTATDAKNLPHETIAAVCTWLVGKGYTPVILDWDRRTILADQKVIFNPGADDPLWGNIGTGDTSRIAALMSRSRLNICIDSGPGKVAMAVDTPCLALWSRHHPVHFADNCLHNTIHLVPEEHSSFIWGDRNSAQVIFDKFYRYSLYKNPAMGDAIINMAAKMLFLADYPRRRR